MNFFQYHGSSIWDERRTILEKAKYWDDDIKVIRYKKYSNGEFEKIEETSSWKFVYKNILYYFHTNFHGQICDLSELNISKEKCLRENYGVYFEFEILKKILNNIVTTTVVNAVKPE